MWDESRAEKVKMERARPRSGGGARLIVQGYFAAFRSTLPGWPREIRYEMHEDGRVLHLEDAQWADWNADGRLLVATVDGRLQVRDYSKDGFSVLSEVDLSALTPSPALAAMSKLCGDEHAIHIGGCGFWIGLRTTRRGGILINLPSYSKISSVQALTMISSDSFTSSRVRS